MKASARTASPEMLRLIVAAVLLCLLWGPIRPIRNVTAQALYTAGDLIAR